MFLNLNDTLTIWHLLINQDLLWFIVNQVNYIIESRLYLANVVTLFKRVLLYL